VSPRYIRTPPERRDDVAAALVSAALGVGVGVVAFYFMRLLLAREPLAGASEGAREARRLEE
jgi:hypothetical protein